MREKGKSTVISFDADVQKMKCLSSGSVAIATSESFYLFDMDHKSKATLHLNGSFPMAISEDPRD